MDRKGDFSPFMEVRKVSQEKLNRQSFTKSLDKHTTNMTENTVLQNVCGMVSKPHAVKLAQNHGLEIMNVTWEDNARTKGSCFGPCISDSK